MPFLALPLACNGRARTRPTVRGGGNRSEVICAVAGEVDAFREVLAQQPVAVLVGAALPWAVRIAEVHRQARLDAQLSVLGHLGALVQVSDRRSC